MASAFNTSTLRISPEVLKLVAEIDEFKGSWIALGRVAPDRLTALRRIATIESIGSSTRIEGARLSDQEVERLLSNLNFHAFATRDEAEVAGYAEVMETLFAHAADISLSENHIKQLHRDLLKYTEKDARHRGEYKTLDNHVEAFGPGGESLGVVFQTASPFDTPRLTTELVGWAQESLTTNALHPLITIALFVVVFLEIHPFQDGNGRLSRILTTLLLLRAGYGYVSYSSLESVIEENKDGYYRALRQTQRTIRTDVPDWTPWFIFFFNALKTQKDRLARKLERERLVLGNLPALSIRILEHCREHGRVTVAEAV